MQAYKVLRCFFTAMIITTTGFTQSPYCWVWTKNIAGTVQSKYVSQHEGFIFNTGEFTGSITIDNTVFTSDVGKDVFIVKRDLRGNQTWSVKIGGPGDETITGIATDKEGSLYAAGTFSGSIITNDTVLTTTGGTDIYIVKLSAAGQRVWLRKIGSTGNDSLAAIVLDPEDHLRLAGSFSADLMMGGYTFSNDGGNSFTASVSPAEGNVLFAKHFPAPTSGSYMKMDRNGNMYYAGVASSSISIGGFIIAPSCKTYGSSYHPVFWVAKFDTLGNLAWAKDLLPCEVASPLEYYRNYLDFYVDEKGFIYLSFVEGAWPALYGPTPVDPYNNAIRIYSPDGIGVNGGGITRFGLPGTADLLRYFLYADNKNILLKNKTNNQVEYVTNLQAQDLTKDRVIGASDPYVKGWIDPVKTELYFTGGPLLVKLGRGLAVNAGADQIVCASTLTTVLGGTPTAVCGQPPYQYLWTPAEGLDLVTSANPTLHLEMVNGENKYAVTVTDAGGMSETDTVVVANRSAPVKPTIYSDNNVLHFHSSAEARVIDWYLNDTPLNLPYQTSLNFPQDGRYLVKVANNDSCPIISDTFYAYKIFLDAGTDTTVCKGASVSLGGKPTAHSASTGLKYSWHPAYGLNDSSVANPAAQPDSAITYIINVRDSFGNHAVDAVRVGIHLPPVPLISQAGNVLHSGYPLGNQWSYKGQPISGETSESIIIKEEGEYTVTVKDNFGCVGMSSPYMAMLQHLKITVFSPAAPGSISIKYVLPVDGAATIILYHLSTGIRTVIVNGERQHSGAHVIGFNTGALPRGIYLLQLVGNGGRVSCKFFL